MVTGRGVSNREREEGEEEGLISIGWDRSYFRAITLIGIGQYIAPTYCGPKMDRVNRGSFQIDMAQIKSFDSNYLTLLLTVWEISSYLLLNSF